jgi:hypothetical protein
MWHTINRLSGWLRPTQDTRHSTDTIPRLEFSYDILSPLIQEHRSNKKEK